jgi:hypothetical protein
MTRPDELKAAIERVDAYLGLREDGSHGAVCAIYSSAGMVSLKAEDLRLLIDAARQAGAWRDALSRIEMTVIAASIASCDCGAKSPEPGFHAAHCRYLKLATVLDEIIDLNGDTQ